jgi:hypothetical protein
VFRLLTKQSRNWLTFTTTKGVASVAACEVLPRAITAAMVRRDLQMVAKMPPFVERGMR